MDNKRATKATLRFKTPINLIKIRFKLPSLRKF